MLSIPLENVDELLGLFGVFDENIGVLEEETGAHIRADSEGVRITGEAEGAEIARLVIVKMSGEALVVNVRLFDHGRFEAVAKALAPPRVARMMPMRSPFAL